jgi:hypothetical protein
MEPVIGIFNTRTEAERAIDRIKLAGIPNDRISLLTPQTAEKLSSVPTTETEQPGMGEAVGAVVGGALGAAGGMSLGAAAASIFVPGVGPVLAIGILGAALLGAGGAVGGAAAGEALEKGMADGLPIDEMFVYEDALRQGRSVVVVLPDSHKQAESVRKILEQTNTESIDAARESWWIGLRDAEEENYKAHGKDFKTDEVSYRKGFEAALRPTIRGQSYDEAVNYLMAHYPNAYREPAFRRGYERGQKHYLGLIDNQRDAA